MSDSARGVDTSDEVIHLDRTRALATLPKAVADEVSAWDELPPELDLDVWIDASSRLGRTSILAPIGGGAGLRDQVDWWDCGTALAADTASAAPSFFFSGLPPCPAGARLTGTLVVSELVVDTAGLNRLRAEATLACSGSAKTPPSATVVYLRYRALG